MSECASKSSCSRESCEGCPSHAAAAGQQQAAKSDFIVNFNEKSSVKHVIGIVSGKGGVGKSSVTSLLASALAKQGLSVGILDADITGPSIPKMFGVKGPVYGTEEGTIVPETANGIKVMSMNLILDNEETPVIWRGPVIAGVVKQFYTDMIWGDIDVMLVDMPPGTGDVPLTVFQSLPVEGIIVVTSPQELVSMIVKKAVVMADKMDIPVLGLVENYSYFECPDCGRRHEIFGHSNIDEVASSMGLEVLARLPIDPAIAKAADAGRIYDVNVDGFENVAKAVAE